MKWAIGISAVILFGWILGPTLLRAMSKHDYDNLANGLQEAKRASGAYVPDKKKRYVSYADKYAYGTLDE